MSSCFIKGEVKGSPISGQGFFASEPIRTGTLIGVFSGSWHLLKMGDVEPVYPDGMDARFCIDLVVIGDDAIVVYLDDPQTIDRMNHSCRPNCSVSGLAVFAAKEISLGGVQRPVSPRELGPRAVEFFRLGDFAGWIIEG